MIMIKNILSISLFIFLIGCAKDNAAEKVLDNMLIEGIKYEIKKNKHVESFEPWNRQIKPIYNVFIKEIEKKTSFEKTIYCIDTLFNRRHQNDLYYEEEDSLMNILQNPFRSDFQKKMTIVHVLAMKGFSYRFLSFNCQTEKVGLIITDTLFLPRNRSFEFQKILTQHSRDTIRKYNYSSFEMQKNMDTISTFTTNAFIEYPLRADFINPITKENIDYRNNLFVKIID